MKTILVYGDSNTWGQAPGHVRYEHKDRWTTKLENLLGDDYTVYSAGVSGRVAGSYENVPAVKRGKDSFEVVYRQAFPVDVVVIALGTNDIKEKYKIETNNIILDLLWYVDQLEELKDYNDNKLTPKVLFLLPTNFDTSLFEGNEEKRQEINKSMRLSGYETVLVGDVSLIDDGVHFSEQGHTQIAQAVYEKLKEMGL